MSKYKPVITPLNAEKKAASTIAKQLCYPKEVRVAIQNAMSATEINSILATARKAL